MKTNHYLKVRKRYGGNHLCLFDLRAILYTSFAMLYITGLADPCGCMRIPGWYVLWFLAGFPQCETLARDQRQVEGRVRLLSPSSLPQAVSPAKPLSSFALTSAGQPSTPTAQLTRGSPTLWP